MNEDKWKGTWYEGYDDSDDIDTMIHNAAERMRMSPEAYAKHREIELEMHYERTRKTQRLTQKLDGGLSK